MNTNRFPMKIAAMPNFNSFFFMALDGEAASLPVAESFVVNNNNYTISNKKSYNSNYGTNLESKQGIKYHDPASSTVTTQNNVDSVMSPPTPPPQLPTKLQLASNIRIADAETRFDTVSDTSVSKDEETECNSGANMKRFTTNDHHYGHQHHDAIPKGKLNLQLSPPMNDNDNLDIKHITSGKTQAAKTEFKLLGRKLQLMPSLPWSPNSASKCWQGHVNEEGHVARDAVETMSQTIDDDMPLSLELNIGWVSTSNAKTTPVIPEINPGNDTRSSSTDHLPHWLKGIDKSTCMSKHGVAVQEPQSAMALENPKNASQNISKYVQQIIKHQTSELNPLMYSNTIQHKIEANSVGYTIATAPRPISSVDPPDLSLTKIRQASPCLPPWLASKPIPSVLTPVNTSTLDLLHAAFPNNVTYKSKMFIPPAKDLDMCSSSRIMADFDIFVQHETETEEQDLRIRSVMYQTPRENVSLSTSACLHFDKQPLDTEAPNIHERALVEFLRAKKQNREHFLDKIVVNADVYQRHPWHYTWGDVQGSLYFCCITKYSRRGNMTRDRMTKEGGRWKQQGMVQPILTARGYGAASKTYLSYIPRGKTNSKGYFIPATPGRVKHRHRMIEIALEEDLQLEKENLKLKITPNPFLVICVLRKT